jgi:hypothetical protein
MTLAQLRALLAAGTPGPWEWEGESEPVGNDDNGIAAQSGGLICNMQFHANHRTVMAHGGELYDHADARLIAAAVNALPALLDVAELADEFGEYARTTFDDNPKERTTCDNCGVTLYPGEHAPDCLWVRLRAALAKLT